MTKLTAVLPSAEAADPAALVSALAREARAAQRQLDRYAGFYQGSAVETQPRFAKTV